ncbi:Arabinose efflux permease [Hoeflea phototrophica DFL-43]|jgi:MFS family permease|uniref:Arabinose efflux permease n=1 Tax=Hoeflea phototrophica (strain DSM 17068 / NCIMB 14078 / DFL-43) TaxID=411684 RepID=A9CUA7_HOEPD|nr:MFS transporter [Hoeflea phototrophica]EDQ35179.1 Arabinose efflux permease [Hoeflea phototrophica DFL-43]
MQIPLHAEDRFAAFRHRAFAFYFIARFLSTFGLQIISVSVGWQIYDLTRDPFDLGLVGLIQFMPALVLILFTGSAADRYGRRTIMMICEVIIGLCALALVYFAWKGLVSPLPIFAVLLVIGISRAFFAPASQSLAPNLVPARDLPNAIAWNSTSWQTATIVGPVAGGLLYGLGPMTPYLTAVGFFALATVFITLVPPPSQRSRGQAQSWDTLMAGFSYVRNQKIVLGAISLDMFAVLLGGAIALMPVFARDVLELGPTGLGWLRAAPGIGAIGMAIYLASRPVKRHAGRAMFIAVGVFGAATMIFGLSTSPLLSIAALIVMGASDMISVYVRQSLVQLWTPDELRGRVSAVNMVFIGASNELGEFRAGTMAALIGPVAAVVIGGAGTLAVALAWSFGFPALRQIQSLDKDAEESRATLRAELERQEKSGPGTA